jgi:hypothetical protein
MNINRFMANIDNMTRTNKFTVNIFGPSGLSRQYKDIFGTGLLDSARLAMGKTTAPVRPMDGEEADAADLAHAAAGGTPGSTWESGWNDNHGVEEVVVTAPLLTRKLEWKTGTSNFSMRGLRCTNITLPGKSFITTPHTTYAGGPKSNRIQGVDYEGGLLSMTFLCDHAFEDKERIELWQSFIHDNAFFYQYYDDYVGRVQIQQNGQDGLPVYAVELHEAWPQAIQAQTLDAASGEIQKLTVSFAYRNWTSSFNRTPSGLLDGFLNKHLRKIDTKISRKLDKLLGF